MAERIIYAVLGVIVLSWLAQVLPRLVPAIVAIGLVAALLRVIWSYTR